MSAQMLSIDGFRGTDLRWVQPKALVRRHELRSGKDLYATLKWVGLLGSVVEAATADGRFTLRRGGFLRPLVTVRDAALGSEVAMLKLGFFGHGTLEFTNGRRVTVRSNRFWSYEWNLLDEGGRLLCKIKKRFGFVMETGDVMIAELVRRDRDLLVMLAASWYAMVLMGEQAATAVVAAGASR